MLETVIEFRLHNRWSDNMGILKHGSIFLAAIVLSWACASGSDGDDRSSSADAGSETETRADTGSGSDTSDDFDSGIGSGSTDDLDTGSESDTDDKEFTQMVLIETTMGDITVGLYGNEAPITVENFLTYVDEGFFADLIFHRVIPDFMIQGGGLDATLTDKEAHAPIALEIEGGIKHEPGVISMARTVLKNSATSQFFICVETLPTLDGEYAAFGRVNEGYDVVEAISLVETHTVGLYENVPVEPVVIKSVTRL